MQLTPELELPDLFEPFPEDLAVLCHANLRGLKQLTVHRMLQRGQYKIIASAQIQEKPTKTSVPKYPVEEICETAMQIIAHDIMETDDPGNYKVSFVGVGGKGRKIVSKHIRMREEQSPRAVNTMDEGDLLETQMQYIGELHQVNMGLMEVVSGMIRPLLEENKEMMKICTESVKKVGEVEAARMAHELEVRKMDDETKIEILREQQSKEKWDELFNHVKNTGAMETILGGLMERFMGKDGVTEQSSAASQQQSRPNPPPPRERPPRRAKPVPRKDEVKSNLPARINKDQPKQIPEKSDSAPVISPPAVIDVEPTQEEVNQELEDTKKEFENMTQLVALAKALKASIEANGQWQMIYKTLNDDQLELLETILESEDDEEIKESVRKLQDTKISKLMILRTKLDEDQRQFIAAIFEQAME